LIEFLDDELQFNSKEKDTASAIIETYYKHSPNNEGLSVRQLYKYFLNSNKLPINNKTIYSSKGKFLHILSKIENAYEIIINKIKESGNQIFKIQTKRLIFKKQLNPRIQEHFFKFLNKIGFTPQNETLK